jgi:hypothetical protein
MSNSRNLSRTIRLDGTTTLYQGADAKLATTSTGITITGDTSATNSTLTGYLRGPASFVIDPAAHGDDTGTVVIAGNLQVDGLTTTINSTTLTVEDKNIILASGASDATAASGAGITVAGASAQLTYDSIQDRWNMNKGLELIGSPLVVGTGSTDVGRVENSAGVFSITAYTGRQIAFGNDSNGEHVRIDADGNVGIGTDDPSTKLNVKHTGGNAVRIETDGDTDSNLLHFKTSSSTGQGYIGTEGSTAGANFTGTTAYAFVAGSTSSGVDTQFLSAGAVRATIDHTGNVGIGTSSPSAALDIEGLGNTVAAHIFTSDNVSNATASLVFGTTPGARTKASIQMVNINTGNAEGALAFSTNSGASLTERMRIDGSGNVGIGTNSPLAKLHVQGNAVIGNVLDYETTHPGESGATLHLHKTAGSQAGNGQVSLGDETSLIISTGATEGGGQGYQGSLWFGTSDHPAGGATVDGSGAQWNWKVAGIASKTTSDTASQNASYGNLEFYTKGSDSTSDPALAMTITQGQYVGIGTDNPSAKTHVVGAAGAIALKVTNSAVDGNTADLVHIEPSNGAYYGKHLRIQSGRSDFSDSLLFLNTTTGMNGTNGSYMRVQNNSGVDIFRIKGDGNVGIGASPIAKLSVVGGTSNASNLATAYSLATFNITPKITSGYSLQFGSGPSDFPYIQMSAGGTASGNLLIQPYGGNVGIGTTSPNQKFEVVGGRSFFVDNNNYYAVGVKYKDANNAMYMGATDSVTAPSLRFSNSGGGHLMAISYTGGVGIGTGGDPTNGKLEVVHSSTTLPAGYFRNSSGSGDSPALVARGGALNSNTAYTFAVQNYNGANNFTVDGTGIIIHNGVSTYSTAFLLVNNVEYNFDINVGNEGGRGNVIEVHAMYDHTSSGYGASLITLVGKRGTSVTRNDIKVITTGNGGSWTISAPDASTLRVTKTAGSYIGDGWGHLTVRFRKS